MNDIIDFDERKKKRNLPGLGFSRRDIYDFLFKINVVDLVWDESDALSFFLRRTKKEEPREIAAIHFDDFKYGQEFLIINLYEESYKFLTENIGQRLLNYFKVPFFVVCVEGFEASDSLTSCLFVCSKCGHTEKDRFFCTNCGHPTGPK